MSQVVIYKDFKAELRFDQDEEHIVVKIIGKPTIFYAKNRRDAEEEFQRFVDQELIGKLSEQEEKLFGKKYSGNIAIRTSSELHQEFTLAADREGISLNSYIEKYLQAAIDREAFGSEASGFINEPSKSKVLNTTSLAVSRLVKEEKASVELFNKIEPFLDREKMNIFLFPSILKRFLANFENSIEEIYPYIKPDKFIEFITTISSLMEQFSDQNRNATSQVQKGKLFKA
jgi:predicted HicB family RNase H-like nuclease